MKTGVVLHYGENFKENALWCVENLIPTYQLNIGGEAQTEENARIIDDTRKELSFEITALVGGWSGPNEWNFVRGPQTLGIVPAAYRAIRMKELLQTADFAQRLGISDVNTHMGFIPENPGDPLYMDFIGAARWLLGEFHNRGLYLNFETGQETPVTLIRAFDDIGAENAGLNFDPANLLMYGKANPIDALSVIGKYIRGVHAKDGEYPTDGYNLGKEMPLGDGSVNFPVFIAKLNEIGYYGALTIEREISGEQQRTDVLKANGLLLDIIKNLS